MYKSADGYDFTMNAKIYAFENRFLFLCSTTGVVVMVALEEKDRKNENEI